MTFFNPFQNLNMGNFMFGMNSWFTPMFSCSFMPSFMNFSAFMPSNWNLPSFSSWGESLFNNFNLTNYGAPSPMSTFTMPSVFENNIFSNSNLSTNNIWDTPSWNNFSTFGVNFSSGNWNRNTSSIGDSFTLTNKNKTTFSMKGYDANAGERLAKIALRNKIGWKSQCAKYVKNAIVQAGLGKYEYGHGYQMASIMRRNKNFKEISPTEYNVNSLPAGCVLVFDRGAQGYNKKYGHVEITTGDGRAVSDGITRNLRQPSAVFVPVNPTA